MGAEVNGKLTEIIFPQTGKFRYVFIHHVKFLINRTIYLGPMTID